MEWLPFGRISEEEGCGLERQSESVSVIAKDTEETLQYEFYVPKIFRKSKYYCAFGRRKNVRKFM